MEENQNSEPVQEQSQNDLQERQQNDVSFPSVGPAKSSGGPKTILVVGILILAAVLGFVVYKSATSKPNQTPEPTPFDNFITPSDSQQGSATPVSTSTPKPADKESVEIQVQNGTGITGEAAFLQTQLKDLGYTNVKVGNASDQNATATIVTYSSKLDSAIVTEITAKLKSLYQNVTVKTSDSGTFDVVIVTGLRKGATSKPSATPAASPSSTTTPKPSATPTATPN